MEHNSLPKPYQDKPTLTLELNFNMNMKIFQLSKTFQAADDVMLLLTDQWGEETRVRVTFTSNDETVITISL